MVRIAGIDIENYKLLEPGLKKIYGIGQKNARQIINDCEISPNTKFINLTEKELLKLRTITNKNYITEGQLQRQKTINLKRLKRISSLRGRRQNLGLPVRGQRTRTNSRTSRKKNS